MKDNECLDISNFQSAVFEMMKELKENKNKNINPLMESIDSNMSMFTENINITLSTNNSS